MMTLVHWGDGMGHMHWGDGMGPMAVGMVIAWLIWTLVGLGVLTALVYWLSRWWRQGFAGTPSAEPAVDILLRRYASGEIDKDDFDRRLADVQATRPR